MISQTIIRTFKKCNVEGNTVKNDGNAKMVVVSTIEEMKYLAIGLFHNLFCPTFVVVFVILSSLSALCAFILPLREKILHWEKFL